MSYFTFEPKKEEDLITLLQCGEGSYEVVKSTDKLSKSNNPMIELILRVWDQTGQEGQIYDYLILNDNKFSQRKIRHFCYASGIQELYEQGKLDPHNCENKCGKLLIGIQKDKSGQYPDKNCVTDYIQTDKEVENKPSFNEDIPF